MYTIQLRKWLAAALLAFFALALVWGMWSLQSQQHLAEEVIRLHVIADSDSAEDQRLKLRVRDAVLEQAEQWLQGVEDRDAAEEIGFLGVMSGPLVRSSYRAGRLWATAMRRRGEEIPSHLSHLDKHTPAKQEAQAVVDTFGPGEEVDLTAEQ